jgi:hypothetical protein
MGDGNWNIIPASPLNKIVPKDIPSFEDEVRKLGG